jgi:hypothetical protein
MKNLISILIGLTCALLHLNGNAGSSSGAVTMMIVNSSNFLFFTAGTKSNSPSCGNNNQWALNLSTPTGRSIYALILSAQAQGKVLYIVGNGTCNGWGDREDVLFAYSE